MSTYITTWQCTKCGAKIEVRHRVKTYDESSMTCPVCRHLTKIIDVYDIVDDHNSDIKMYDEHMCSEERFCNTMDLYEQDICKG